MRVVLTNDDKKKVLSRLATDKELRGREHEREQ